MYVCKCHNYCYIFVFLKPSLIIFITTSHNNNIIMQTITLDDTVPILSIDCRSNCTKGESNDLGEVEILK